jgi:hypothetical protein
MVVTVYQDQEPLGQRARSRALGVVQDAARHAARLPGQPRLPVPPLAVQSLRDARLAAGLGTNLVQAGPWPSQARVTRNLQAL